MWIRQMFRACDSHDTSGVNLHYYTIYISVQSLDCHLSQRHRLKVSQFQFLVSFQQNAPTMTCCHPSNKSSKKKGSTTGHGQFDVMSVAFNLSPDEQSPEYNKLIFSIAECFFCAQTTLLICWWCDYIFQALSLHKCANRCCLCAILDWRV